MLKIQISRNSSSVGEPWKARPFEFFMRSYVDFLARSHDGAADQKPSEICTMEKFRLEVVVEAGLSAEATLIFQYSRGHSGLFFDGFSVGKHCKIVKNVEFPRVLIEPSFNGRHTSKAVFPTDDGGHNNTRESSSAASSISSKDFWPTDFWLLFRALAEAVIKEQDVLWPALVWIFNTKEVTDFNWHLWAYFNGVTRTKVREIRVSKFLW